MKFIQSWLGSLSTGRDQAVGAIRAALFIALVVVLCGPAAADMYTVSGIPIEANGESAAAAKSVAIAEGQASAYGELLGRVAHPDDLARLPMPDPSTLQGVVAGYSLDNERTGPTQYLADLTVRFNPESVELLLSQYGIKLAVEQSLPALIVPISWTGEQGLIWESENTWRAVWERIDLDNRLVPALLPLGDATDASVDTAALSRADPTALKLLGDRYGVEFAFISLFAHDPASGRMEASLTGRGPLGTIDVREQATAEKGNEAATMTTLANALIDRLDAEWRTALESRSASDSSQTVTLGVPFGNLQEWVAIRSRLEAALGADMVDVRALNAGSAQVQISFEIEVSELAAQLESQGLYLYDDGANWILRTN